jgi:hypothetical protein
MHWMRCMACATSLRYGRGCCVQCNRLGMFVQMCNVTCSAGHIEELWQ